MSTFEEDPLPFGLELRLSAGHICSHRKYSNFSFNTCNSGCIASRGLKPVEPESQGMNVCGDDIQYDQLHKLSGRKIPKVNQQDAVPNVGLRLGVPNLRRMAPSSSCLLPASLPRGASSSCPLPASLPRGAKRLCSLACVPRRIQRLGEGSNCGVVEL